MPTDLPNLLTISRIAAIPVLVVFAALGTPWGDFASCLVFSVAGITDYFDGKIARDRGVTSSFGRMLDPIADKLLVGAALMLLVGLDRLSHLALYPAIVIMLREIMVSGLREYLASLRVGMPVTRLAKWKTTAQMVAIPVLLIAGALEFEARHGMFWVSPSFHASTEWLFSTAGIVLIWAAGLLTVLTGLDYLHKAMPFLRDRKR